MNIGPIALPPRGGAIVFPADVLATAQVGPEHHGILISREGRIAICAAGGGGMAVQLSAIQAAALGLLLTEIGRLLDEQAQAAANAATEALDRIQREVAGNA